jgi:hypothetical protein
MIRVVNKMKYEPRHPQPFHNYPIAFPIRMLQLVVQYVAESGAGTAESQVHWLGQYI